MGLLSILSFAHKLIEERLRPGDTAIDATVGNGVDTLMLARLVGPRGRIYGFDVQAQALENARARFERELGSPSGAAEEITLALISHAEMETVLPENQHGTVGAVMFNLGYLPGADPSVITRPDSTLPALEAALRMLRTGGVLTIAVYPGHEGGGTEADAVLSWAEALPQNAAQAVIYRFVQRPQAPFLIAVEKR